MLVLQTPEAACRCCLLSVRTINERELWYYRPLGCISYFSNIIKTHENTRNKYVASISFLPKISVLGSEEWLLAMSVMSCFKASEILHFIFFFKCEETYPIQCTLKRSGSDQVIRGLTAFNISEGLFLELRFRLR